MLFPTSFELSDISSPQWILSALSFALALHDSASFDYLIYPLLTRGNFLPPFWTNITRLYSPFHYNYIPKGSFWLLNSIACVQFLFIISYASMIHNGTCVCCARPLQTIGGWSRSDLWWRLNCWVAFYRFPFWLWTTPFGPILFMASLPEWIHSLHTISFCLIQTLF